MMDALAVLAIGFGLVLLLTLAIPLFALSSTNTHRNDRWWR
jgi:hypothetical protein